MSGLLNDDQWVDQCQRQTSTQQGRDTLSKIPDLLRSGDLEQAFTLAKELKSSPEDELKLLNFILSTKVKDAKLTVDDNKSDIGPISESTWVTYAAARLSNPNKAELGKIERLAEIWDRSGKADVLESASMGDYQKGNGVALAEVIVQTRYDRDDDVLFVSREAADWADGEGYGPHDFEEGEDEDYDDEDEE